MMTHSWKLGYGFKALLRLGIGVWVKLIGPLRASAKIWIAHNWTSAMRAVPWAVTLMWVSVLIAGI